MLQQMIGHLLCEQLPLLLGSFHPNSLLTSVDD
jgi:hypothetical protein